MLADAGFSSGEALKSLEENKITGYIPNRPQFVYERPALFITRKETITLALVMRNFFTRALMKHCQVFITKNTESAKSFVMYVRLNLHVLF